MKKFFVILLAAALLAGCGDRAGTEAEPSDCFVIDYNDFFGYEGGELYVDVGRRLHFADLSTGADVFICPRPNCPHTDESCSALGMDNHPVIVGGSIYWFGNQSYYEGNLPRGSLNVYKAAIDGTGRAKCGEVDGITVPEGASAAFKNGVLYFGGVNEHPEGKPEGMREMYLCGYDYAKKDLIAKVLLCEGYTAGVTFCGEIGGELYYILNYQEEDADWWDGDSLEAREHNGAELRRVSLTEYGKIDLETLVISEWELPEKIVSAHEKRAADPSAPVLPIYAQIKEGAAIYSDGADTLIVSPDGREIFIKDFNGNDTAVVNGYIFGDIASGENTVRRLSDGKEVRANIPQEGVAAGYVAGYSDGKYMIRYIDLERQQTVYFAVSEEELFGE